MRMRQRKNIVMASSFKHGDAKRDGAVVKNGDIKIDEAKIAAMREGGKIMGQLMHDLKAYVQAGMTEKQVDAWVRAEIVRRGAEVAYDNLEVKFPGAICISTNDQIVHGAPSDYEFVNGDVVSFDLDIFFKGYYTDSAFTMIVGGEKYANGAVRQLLKTTEASFWAGANMVRAGVRLGDVGHAVEKVLRKGKLGVIMNYIGHGIGKTMHEDPEVPNYGIPGHGYVLKAGDTICIEPMASMGKATNFVGDDGWTVYLSDGSLGAHYEHTILVLEDGCEVLTKWPED